MTGLCSYKTLEQAISDGETSFKITTKRFLTACVMAERCGFDMANIGRYVGMVQAAQRDKSVRRDPDFSIGLLDAQGKPQKMFVNFTVIACAIRVIQLLDSIHARISLQKEEGGYFTGVADVTTFV